MYWFLLKMVPKKSNFCNEHSNKKLIQLKSSEVYQRTFFHTLAKMPISFFISRDPSVQSQVGRHSVL